MKHAPTRQLFTEDAYLTTTEAEVIQVTDEGHIILDQTPFYANSGGQPGDTGTLERSDGSMITICDTVFAPGGKETILHQATTEAPLPQTGEKLIAHIDWAQRYDLMRMHTACHLLSVICPRPITGASVSLTDSRIDFDMSEPADKSELTEGLMDLVSANHPVFTRCITREELDANPGLVKSKNVKPPQNIDHIRLVCIGEDAVVDSQPCGGTHVSETGEIDQIHIGKIEKKGRENRRMRLRFGPSPSS